MPIPGDNGKPKLEREQQEARIREVALTGANIEPVLNHWEKPAKSQPIHLDGGIYKRR